MMRKPLARKKAVLLREDWLSLHTGKLKRRNPAKRPKNQPLPALSWTKRLQAAPKKPLPSNTACKGKFPPKKKGE